MSKLRPFDIRPTPGVRSPIVSPVRQRLSLEVSEELAIGQRMKLARVAADLDPDAVAAAFGISRRTYDRIEAGERSPKRAELVVFAQLTDQDTSFFGISSFEGESILSDIEPHVNGRENGS